MWTEERVEMAEKLWAQGHSARAIAKQLGGLTRNAVIGKMHRLGHKRSDFGQGQTFGKAAGIALRKRRKPKTCASLKVGPLVAVEGPLPPEQPAPDKLVRLADLDEHQCRYPFGDPKREGFGFCGCATAPGSSYCPSHLALCTREPPPVTRKRTLGTKSDRTRCMDVRLPARDLEWCRV